MTPLEFAKQQEADKMEFAANILRAMIVSPGLHHNLQPQALVNYAVVTTDLLYDVYQDRIAALDATVKDRDDDRSQIDLDLGPGHH